MLTYEMYPDLICKEVTSPVKLATTKKNLKLFDLQYSVLQANSQNDILFVNYDFV
jgi:hypothetical protein